MEQMTGQPDLGDNLLRPVADRLHVDAKDCKSFRACVRSPSGQGTGLDVCGEVPAGNPAPAALEQDDLFRRQPRIAKDLIRIRLKNFRVPGIKT
jgi:hypothetical protein